MLTVCKHLLHLIGIKYSLFAILFFSSALCFILSFSEITNALSLFYFIKILLLGGTAFVSARSVGMIVNQVVDLAIDKKNVRTSARVIPQRKISIFFAKCVVLVCCVLFLYLSFCLNARCVALAIFSLFVIFLYPYTKRYTCCCHWILGSIYYLAILMILTIFQPEMSLQQFVMISLLGGSISLIIAANDIIYAIQDIAFDRAENLFSIPCLFGRYRAVRIAQFCLILSLLLYLALGFLSGFGLRFFISSAFVYLAYVYTIRRYQTALTESNEGIMQIFFYGNIVLAISFFVSMFLLCLLNLMDVLAFK